MPGGGGKDAFHEFQAERNGAPDELRVVVRRESIPLASQAVGYGINGDGLDETAV